MKQSNTKVTQFLHSANTEQTDKMWMPIIDLSFSNRKQVYMLETGRGMYYTLPFKTLILKKAIHCKCWYFQVCSCYQFSIAHYLSDLNPSDTLIKRIKILFR